MSLPIPGTSTKKKVDCTRFCCDLCVLTIALSESYSGCLEAYEFVFDTYLSNFQHDIAPILFFNLKYKFIKNRHLYKPQNDYSNGLITENKEIAQLLLNENHSGSIFELVGLIQKHLLKAMTTTSYFKSLKVNFYMAFKMICLDDVHSPFHDLRLFLLNIINKGYISFLNDINEVKALNCFLIEYEHEGETKQIKLSDYMPNILSFMYNLLIVIQMVVRFMISLPSFNVGDKEPSYVELDVHRDWKMFLSHIDIMGNKVEDLLKYTLEKNYLKKIYSNNFINNNYFKFINHEELYKELNNENILNLKFLNRLFLIKESQFKGPESLHNASPKDGKPIKKEKENDIKKFPIFKFPSFEEFIMSTRYLRILNINYQYHLTTCLNYKMEGFHQFDLAKTNSAKVFSYIAYSANLLDNNTYYDLFNGELKAEELLEVFRKIQLPTSSMILTIIFQWEAINQFLGVFLGTTLARFQEHKTYLDGDEKNQLQKKLGIDYIVEFENIKNYPDIDKKAKEFSKITDTVPLGIKSSNVINEQIDITVKHINMVTRCREMIIKELTNKKIYVDEFMKDLQNLLKEINNPQKVNSLKKKFFKYTKREEKLIFAIFLKNLTEYFDNLKILIYDLFQFNSLEAYEKIFDKLWRKNFQINKHVTKFNESVEKRDNPFNTQQVESDLIYDLKNKTVVSHITKLIALGNQIHSYVEKESPKIVDKKGDDKLLGMLTVFTKEFDVTMGVYPY